MPRPLLVNGTFNKFKLIHLRSIGGKFHLRLGSREAWNYGFIFGSDATVSPLVGRGLIDVCTWALCYTFTWMVWHCESWQRHAAVLGDVLA